MVGTRALGAQVFELAAYQLKVRDLSASLKKNKISTKKNKKLDFMVIKVSNTN